MRRVAIISTLLALAACGGTPASTPTASAPAAGTSITAAASEFAFAPSSWTVPAGQQISITFQNEGTAEHEWVIIRDQEQIATEAEFSDDLVLFQVQAVPAGDSANETFTAPPAGTYQVICALPGHFAAGMRGTLTVAP